MSRTRSLPRLAWALALLAATAGCSRSGILELSIVDAATGGVAPARLELLDAAGSPTVPADALPVAGDCGWFPYHNRLGLWSAQVQMVRALERAVDNPFTGTRQFYAVRPLRVRLAPGSYRLRVFKGIEYRVARRQIEIRAGDRRRLEVRLERWIDLPAEGWYGADDHLHLARTHRRFDRLLGSWMAAEDLHVANLLQMGLSGDVHITPQFAFGDGAVHHRGTSLLASGQENPRTHVLGHAIALGADSWVDFPESYLSYDRFFREVRRRGGINGYAHWGLAGGEEALPLWSRDALVDFVEVLGFGFAFYDLWYELLDLGLRVTPTAGTDFPCGPNLPGRDRFYARVGGPLGYRAWLEAVRGGHTFVTNGPVLDLEIAGPEDRVAGPGDTLRLPEPGAIRVRGRVRFDPGRDEIRRLEMVRAGVVVPVATAPVEAGEIRFETELAVARSTWLALRARGAKPDELPVEAVERLASHLTYLDSPYSRRLVDTGGLPANGSPQPAAAHTGAIWVHVDGSPAIHEQPRARAVARAWLDRLAGLEARFGDDRLTELAGFPGRGDGLSAADLMAQRAALLDTLAAARRHYHDRAHGTGDGR